MVKDGGKMVFDMIVLKKSVILHECLKAMLRRMISATEHSEFLLRILQTS